MNKSKYVEALTSDPDVRTLYELAEGTELVRDDDLLAYTREVLDQHDNWLTVDHAVSELKTFGVVMGAWLVFAAFVTTVLWMGGVL